MNREFIMSTLFARLTSPPLVFPFTADLTAGDIRLANVSDTSGLFLGMPISGPGLVAGTTLATIEPDVTLSKPVNSGGFAVLLTQGFATTGRRLLTLSEVTNLPALFLVEGNETHPGPNQGFPRAPTTRPQMITLDPYLWIYASNPDPNGVPNAIINVLLDGIDKVMLPADGRFPQNLGLRGVDHCRIEGKTLRAPGSDGTVNARVQLAVEVIQGVDTVPL